MNQEKEENDSKEQETSGSWSKEYNIASETRSQEAENSKNIYAKTLKSYYQGKFAVWEEISVIELNEQRKTSELVE